MIISLANTFAVLLPLLSLFNIYAVLLQLLIVDVSLATKEKAQPIIDWSDPKRLPPPHAFCRPREESYLWQLGVAVLKARHDKVWAPGDIAETEVVLYNHNCTKFLGQQRFTEPKEKASPFVFFDLAEDAKIEVNWDVQPKFAEYNQCPNQNGPGWHSTDCWGYYIVWSCPSSPVGGDGSSYCDIELGRILIGTYVWGKYGNVRTQYSRIFERAHPQLLDACDCLHTKDEGTGLDAQTYVVGCSCLINTDMLQKADGEAGGNNGKCRGTPDHPQCINERDPYQWNPNPAVPKPHIKTTTYQTTSTFQPTITDYCALSSMSSSRNCGPDDYSQMSTDSSSSSSTSSSSTSSSTISSSSSSSSTSASSTSTSTSTSSTSTLSLLTSNASGVPQISASNQPNPSTSGTVVSQNSGGQPQIPAITGSTSALGTFTGTASAVGTQKSQGPASSAGAPAPGTQVTAGQSQSVAFPTGTLSDASGTVYVLRTGIIVSASAPISSFAPASSGSAGGSVASQAASVQRWVNKQL